MKVLVTTSHSLLRLDVDEGTIEPLHRGLGLYFGIATAGGRTFVAARGRMVSSDVPADEERGRILVFDEDLRLAGELHAPFALRDMHEILWHDGALWITCSRDNMVAVHHPASGRWERWFPLGETDPTADHNHLNSLAWIERRLWIVAHNRGPSELLAFDPATRELVERVPLGVQAHNIRVRDGALLTCSSGEGELVATDGWRLHVGGFPRGLLIGRDRHLVGISEVLERKERDLSHGRIDVFDAGWRLRGSIELEREGLVLEIAPAPLTGE